MVHVGLNLALREPELVMDLVLAITHISRHLSVVRAELDVVEHNDEG